MNCLVKLNRKLMVFLDTLRCFMSWTFGQITICVCSSELGTLVWHYDLLTFCEMSMLFIDIDLLLPPSNYLNLTTYSEFWQIGKQCNGDWQFCNG